MLTLIKTNNRVIKNLIIFATIFICLYLFANPVIAVVKPTDDFYVNDYANLLNNETKEYIMKSNISLNEKTGAQIVVVTVESLEGNSIEEYSTELFRKFGIGDKEKNNGLLLLLALQERKFRVEVGYGLEGILPDAKTGRIQDQYIIPYLKNDNWNEGIKNGFSAFLQIIADEYGVDIELDEPIKTTKTTMDMNTIGPLLFLGFIIGLNIFSREKNKIRSLLIQVVIILTFFCNKIMYLIEMFKNPHSIILGIISIIIGLLLGIGLGKLMKDTGSGIGGGFYGGGFHGGGFSGGGSSGGGFSGGGGSSRWWWKFKRFLVN